MPTRVRSLLLLTITLGVLGAAVAWQADDATTLHPSLAKSSPTFWKGNLHTHSLWSDGDDFPEMIVDWYKRHGYHFLGLSDHNVLSEGERWIDVTTPKGSRAEALKKYRQRFGPRWVEERNVDKKDQVRLKPLADLRGLFEEPNRFLLIPAEEITHRFDKNPVHMNAVNLRDVVQPLSAPNVRETIQVNMRQVAEQRTKTKQNMLVFLNHPNFGNGVNAEDMLVEELKFFEVFNGHPGVKNYGTATRPGTERLWDVVLAHRLGKFKQGPVYGVGTDDAHAYHAMAVGKSNPGRGWIMVRAPFLTPEAIVNAMETGDFYASSGVRLKDFHWDGRTFRVEIDGEQGIEYKTEFIGTMKGVSLESDEPLEKGASRVYRPEIGKVLKTSQELASDYASTGEELYIRVRITSTKKHPNPFAAGDVEMAWTQPVTPR